MNETLATLLESLQHVDSNVRSRTVLQLGDLGDSDALDALLTSLRTEQNFFVREDITWALVRMKDVALQPLIGLLQDPDPSTRHQAAHVLGKISDSEATTALINALQDSDPVVVSKAAFSLGQLGASEAVRPLIGLLATNHRELQSTLVTVLENFGTPAVQPLIDALAHEHWQVRELSADILGLIGSRAAAPALIEMLSDNQWQVRFAAVTALGHIGGEEAHAALLQIQHDEDERVNGAVPKMLKRMRK